MRRLLQYFREKGFEKGGKRRSFRVNFSRFSERELEDENFMKTKERILPIKMERLYLKNCWNYQWLLASSSTTN